MGPKLVVGWDFSLISNSSEMFVNILGLKILKIFSSSCSLLRVFFLSWISFQFSASVGGIFLLLKSFS